METQNEELSAYEKRVVQLLEHQTDSLELLRWIGVAVLIALVIGVVFGAVIAFS